MSLLTALPCPSCAPSACSEQLTAFELWLEHGGPDKKPPEQLPIVLQVRCCCCSGLHRPTLFPAVVTSV